MTPTTLGRLKERILSCLPSKEVMMKEEVLAETSTMVIGSKVAEEAVVEEAAGVAVAASEEAMIANLRSEEIEAVTEVETEVSILEVVDKAAPRAATTFSPKEISLLSINDRLKP